MTTTTRFSFDLAQIEELINLLKTSGINEIELAQGDLSLRLRREEPQAARTVAVPAAVAAPAPVVAPAIAGKPKIEGHVIESPMVGTFYASPTPNADPFVSTGTKVKKGQTLCIIEAMKTLNHIEAERDGIVRDVLVQNAQPVEFGEPLFVLE